MSVVIEGLGAATLALSPSFSFAAHATSYHAAVIVLRGCAVFVPERLRPLDRIFIAVMLGMDVGFTLHALLPCKGVQKCNIKHRMRMDMRCMIWLDFRLLL